MKNTFLNISHKAGKHISGIARFTFLGALIITALLLTIASTAGRQKDDLNRRPSKFVDVAIDATTFRFSRESAVLPSNVIRGDTFIVDGLIYPGESIPHGNTPFPATSAQPIGRWICRGTFQTDTAGLVAGVTPHVYSTQYFEFFDGKAIVVEGPEGGAVFERAVTGGWGGGQSGGQSVETPIGANATGLFNLQFEFRSGEN